MKILKYFVLCIVLIFSFLLLGLVVAYKYVESSSTSYKLMKQPQKIYFEVRERVEGQTPERKLWEITNAIISKNQNSYESLYPIENLGWVSLYENDQFSTDNLNEVKENRDKQSKEAKSILWKENISSYKILSAKYFNQPCCAIGWTPNTDLSWIGMARYEIEFTTTDSRKLKYNIEITVSNPGWLEPGDQVEVRKWIVTNISNKELPELYKGMGI